MSDKTSKKDKKPILSLDALREAGESAARETNAELDARIASITKLTAQEIHSAFPTKADKQKLDELIGILKSETAQQEKIQAIVDNSERFAGVIFTLLGRII